MSVEGEWTIVTFARFGEGTDSSVRDAGKEGGSGRGKGGRDLR